MASNVVGIADVDDGEGGGGGGGEEEGREHGRGHAVEGREGLHLWEGWGLWVRGKVVRSGKCVPELSDYVRHLVSLEIACI